MAVFCKSLVPVGHVRRLVSLQVPVVVRKISHLASGRSLLGGHFIKPRRFVPCKCLSVSAVGRSGGQRTEEFFKPTETLSDASSASGDTVATSAVDGTSLAAQLAASGSPREAVDLASLGLGGYWPSGLVQSALELLYNNVHLPWWGCVAALTVVLRLATLPLNVKMQVLSAKLANTNKEAKVYHAKMEACKAAGDQAGASQAGVEIFKMYQREGVNPIMMFPLAVAQAPVFLAMFRGLRGMAVVPVESLQTGGMLWFVDLALPDPYYGLPLLACVSFLANLQLGGEGGAATDNELSKRVRWVLRVGAVAVLPITSTLPSVVLVYWVTNSLCSMAFILCFKLHAVKRLFGIPLIKRD